jgi:rubrerythrin
MNIFDYAMKMENDGRTFYLDHADKVDAPELKKILLELADDELKHYRIFKAMKEGTPVEFEEAKRTRILTTVKNVFEQMRGEGKDFSFAADAKKIWEEAREIEKMAEEFYREKADEVSGEDQRHILNRIAGEEHRHWITIQNVIEFLDRPRQWLEDAEWTHQEDY